MRSWSGLYLLGIFIGLGCVLPGISTAQLDTNNNGLSDVWEDLFSPVPMPLSSDVDDDTLNTLQECIAGTDPRNAASVHRVSEIFNVNSVSQINYFRLRWRSQPGKEYKLRVAHPGQMNFTELDNTRMLGNGGFHYIYQYHSSQARGSGGVSAEVWNQLPAGVTSVGGLSATTATPDAILGLDELRYDDAFGQPFSGMRVRGYFLSSNETGNYTIDLDTAGSGVALFRLGDVYGALDTVSNAVVANPAGSSAPVELRRYQPYPFELDYLHNAASGLAPTWVMSADIRGNTNAPPTTPQTTRLLFWLDSERTMNPLLADHDSSVFDVLVRDRDDDNDGVTNWEELELELAPWNPATFNGIADDITAANLLGGVNQTVQLVANPSTTLIEGTGASVTYTLERVIGTGAFTVPYTLGGQSESSDVLASSSAFVFADGQDAAQVTFNARADDRLEPAEFAVITVQPPAAVTLLGSPYGGFSIEDELDPQPILYVAEYGPENDADTGATGFSTLLLSADRRSALVASSFENLTSPQTVAHIHRGPVGVSGPVVFGLPTGTFNDLVWSFGAPPADMDMPGMVMAATDHQAVLDDLSAGRLYANVHSAIYGSGEIRGNYGVADGSDSFIPPDPLPQDPGAPNPADVEVFRFLEQASFGPIASERSAVKSMGMRSWINTQMSASLTPQTSVVTYNIAANEWELDAAINREWDQLFGSYKRNSGAGIWSSALDGNDQLRQRMAFALSEIFVISTEDNTVFNSYLGKSHYWDMLAGHAFGNFRDLLEDVSRHPLMGYYLSHMKNRKANEDAGTKPDENYAREVMQLFSIGLLELHPDGSLKLDPTSNQPIPTYSNEDITELANFFTGFAHAFQGDGSVNTSFGHSPNNTDEVLSTVVFAPMKMFADHHDFSEKTILKDVVIPANLEMETEIDLVMDALFNHENTAPFIARRLIQRLTTSNPSRGYIYRVAQAFEDNGAGVRGDLAAVTRAILLDQEARNPTYYSQPTFGKAKEPLLRFTAAMRTINWSNDLPMTDLGPYGVNPTHYRPGARRVLLDNTDRNSRFFLSQSFLRAPTVFNWFLPDYSPAGILSDNGLYAPETQILTDNFLVDNVNTMTTLFYYTGKKSTGALYPPDGLESADRLAHQALDDIQFDLSEFDGLSMPALVDELDDRFFGGRMSTPLRNAILTNIPNVADGFQVRSALSLAFVSPEFASQQ